MPDAPAFLGLLQFAASSEEHCTFVLTQILHLASILEHLTDEAGRRILSSVLRDLLSLPPTLISSAYLTCLPEQVKLTMSVLHKLHTDERDFNRQVKVIQNH